MEAQLARWHKEKLTRVSECALYSTHQHSLPLSRDQASFQSAVFFHHFTSQPWRMRIPTSACRRHRRELQLCQLSRRHCKDHPPPQRRAAQQRQRLLRTAQRVQPARIRRKLHQWKAILNKLHLLLLQSRPLMRQLAPQLKRRQRLPAQLERRQLRKPSVASRKALSCVQWRVGWRSVSPPRN